MKRTIILMSFLLLLSCKDQQAPKPQHEAQVAMYKPEKTPVSKIHFDFENDEIGKVPKNWSAKFTGNWAVADDEGNKVLKQTSSGHSGSYFNVIVNDEIQAEDVEITVRFKGLKGKEDQGGGPVWRYRNIKNYYIARANPLENNYRVYKVENGRRKELKSARLNIETGKWYTLKIMMKGEEIRCYFNGKLELETTDDTFKEKGKVGLWTKADAVTAFDDMDISIFK